MSGKSGPKTLYPYRSNIVTFKMTTEGLTLLQKELDRLAVLRGDLLELLVRKHAASITADDITELRKQTEH